MELALVEPNPWMILPFIVLLGSIALGPLLFANWWARHYPKVAYSLGAITLAYYLFGLEARDAFLSSGWREFVESWINGDGRQTVIHTAMEYVSFIVLIGSLFVVSGGIHITVKGQATPMANVVFLGLGAVLANILGTTGASMLLIRPWIRMNKYRVTTHHIVFFIFIVSNVGGCLTPIGDPPLFLGYLKGIPFWWTLENCWPMWAVGLAILLGIFYVIDDRNYLRAPKKVRETLAEPPDRWRFDGLANLFFLALILTAVFIIKPIFLREAVMLAAALGSYYTTRKSVHQANDFNFHPIQEVAILFVGIFATMMPALDWLQMNADKMGNPSVSFFYWGSGLLSSVLDNAPTYLSFLKVMIGGMLDQDIVENIYQIIQASGTATGAHAEQINQTLQVLQKYHPAQLMNKSVTREEIETAYLLGSLTLNKYLLAISVGAVFFGACTYIGNGPNFMVKAIAHHNHVNTPSFLGYIFKYTLPFMAPMLIVVWWLFFS